MKQLLIVYSRMMVGGSTTSLLSLLNSLDYSRYQVDLLLYDHTGELQSRIPKEVHLLEPAARRRSVWRKYLNPGFWIGAARAHFLSRRHHNRLIRAQCMAKYEAKCCRPLPKRYDVGISFLEFWPCEYLVSRVRAEKKVGWIHIDVREAGLLPRLNVPTLRRLDTVVLVSESCLASFREWCPALSHKAVCVENILSGETIRSFSQSPSPLSLAPGPLRFVTTCRIVFASKGLDRAVSVFARLRREHLLGDAEWYILGDGPDLPELRERIRAAQLDNHVHLLGQQLNPYCMEKDMDIFLLPSRFEGRPMAVTEAQMLGLVPLVCRYSSAESQIQNGVDGIIADNSEDGLYTALRAVLTGEVDLLSLKQEVRRRDYTNTQEIQRIYRILES